MFALCLVSVMDETQSATVVVYNPAKIDESTLRSHVERYAPQSRRIEWVETTPDDSGEAEAAAVSQPGVELVLVAGGDGTVRQIAAALAGLRIALGIIPTGTGNLLARNLRLDLDLEASVKRAFNGERMLIDVCRAKLSRPDGTNERLGFVVMAGVGLDAQMIEYTDEGLKKRIGPLAYVSGIARSLRGGNRIKATYTVDGERTRSTRLHTLIFGNCGELINEIPLFPEARPDDGLLYAVGMAPRGPIGWVKIGLNLVANKVARMRGRETDRAAVNFADLTYSEGQHAHVTFENPEIFEIDGDPVGEVIAVEIEVESGALKVCV